MSFLQKVFGFHPETMTLRTEIMAGFTTFLTMIYVLAVNPAVLANAGMPQGALFTTTVITTVVATFFMAVIAKQPIAQAPSMCLNAFFAFTLCMVMGYTWQQALSILLVESLIFLAISLGNIRQIIIDSIPANLRVAIAVGIGMFIAFIGLKNADIIVANEATLVSLGDFSPKALVGVASILVSAVLMALNVKGALFIAIIVATLVGILLGVTTVPEAWSPVSMPDSIAPIFCQFDFSQLLTMKSIVVIFSLLVVHMFDTIGTIVGLAYTAGIVKKDGTIPRIHEAMLSDALGTTFGVFLGCSSVSAYSESASGISAGGRSGITALTVAFFFLLALFFSPLFLLIPGAATSGALVMVGVLMIREVKEIDFSDFGEAFAAFITILGMVLCYSIADGVCLGMLSYTIVKLCTGKVKQLSWVMVILSLLFLGYFCIG